MRTTLACLALVAVLGCAIPAGAETLLVVRKTDNAIDFIDPGSALRLATVPLDHGPHEVSVSPDGQRAAVTNYGTRERPGSTLSIVDLGQPRELARIELGAAARPHGVAWFAPDRIAVTAEGLQQLLIVEPDAGRVVAAIPTAQDVSHMVAVDAAGERAYVTNIGSGTTTALDLVAGRSLGNVATGAGSEALALAPDGRELWVAARAAGEIAIVDTGTLEVMARLPLAGIPIRIVISRDGRSALVTCAGSAEVVAFDVATRSERTRRAVDVPMADDADARPFARLAPGSVLPVGITLAGDGASVFVAATMGDAIVRFDASSLAPLATIPVEGEPDGLAVTGTLPRAHCHACRDD